MVACFLSSGKWAVVLSITLGGQGVEVVLSRVARLGTVLRSLAGWLSHRERREELRFDLDLGLRGRRQGRSAGLLGRPDGPVLVVRYG